MEWKDFFKIVLSKNRLNLTFIFQNSWKSSNGGRKKKWASKVKVKTEWDDVHGGIS